jgi:hypothetical protein
MVVTVDQVLLLLLSVVSVGQFVVLMLLYWGVLVSPFSKRNKTNDKGWL